MIISKICHITRGTFLNYKTKKDFWAKGTPLIKLLIIYNYELTKINLVHRLLQTVLFLLY